MFRLFIPFLVIVISHSVAQAIDDFDTQVKTVCENAQTALNMYKSVKEPSVGLAWLPSYPAEFVIWHKSDENYFCNMLDGVAPFNVADVVKELKQSSWVKRKIETERDLVRKRNAAVDLRRSDNPQSKIDYSNDAEVQRVITETENSTNASRKFVIAQNCSPVFKDNISETYESKPVIEIVSCGSCTSADREKIKAKNIKNFIDAVSKNPVVEYIHHTFLDFGASCSLYTYISPTVRLKKLNASKMSNVRPADSSK